jgi:hypothetical protein
MTDRRLQEAQAALDELRPVADSEARGLIKMLTFGRCAQYLYRPLYTFFKQKARAMRWWSNARSLTHSAAY